MSKSVCFIKMMSKILRTIYFPRVFGYVRQICQRTQTNWFYLLIISSAYYLFQIFWWVIQSAYIVSLSRVSYFFFKVKRVYTLNFPHLTYYTFPLSPYKHFTWLMGWVFFCMIVCIGHIIQYATCRDQNQSFWKEQPVQIPRITWLMTIIIIITWVNSQIVSSK